MKILAVCNLYPPYVVGGNEVRLSEIVDELRRRHEVLVLSSLYDAPPDEGVERSLRQIAPYPDSVGSSWWGPVLFKEWRIAAHNYRRAREVLQRFDPDVVYMSDTKRVFLGAPFAAMDAGKPLVWDITDLGLLYYRGRPGFRRRLANMHLKRLPFGRSIAVSSFIRDALVRGGVLPESAVAINQGVHLDNFRVREPLPPGQKPRKMLFVGGLIHDKGLHVVLRGLKLLLQHSGDYSLTVCGDGGETDYKAGLFAYVEKEGLADQVDFRGRVPMDQIPSIYREHDIFVFSSIWDEPFASTPLEAMASGVPVVGTLVGGQQGFFINGQNSMTYGKEDPAELCARVRQLEDRALYDAIARRGVEQALADHDFGDYVAKIEAILQAAAAGGGKSD